MYAIKVKQFVFNTLIRVLTFHILFAFSEPAIIYVWDYRWKLTLCYICGIYDNLHCTLINMHGPKQNKGIN